MPPVLTQTVASHVAATRGTLEMDLVALVTEHLHTHMHCISDNNYVTRQSVKNVAF